ncbi:MAG TPA: alkene reductase [Rhodocyclaceae bacterium]|nr:alkene reductase [Rhodocyclaceae bacterium]
MSASKNLFEPYSLGPLSLANRIVMPPLTRARSSQPGNVPNALMAEYYAQRSDAGLIIAEATDISADAKGYSQTPGVHSRAQIEGWRLVTEAVHARGGRIFLQIWHTGRMSHPDLRGGAQTVAPSAIPFQGQIWMTNANGVGRMVDCPTPRALTLAEIGQIVADFRQAALNAIEAGFDGVEIHAANAYLIDQFLRTTSNRRDDAYGGSRANRQRFLLEVVDAVAGAIGPQRVGVRLSPHTTARGMDCPDILPTTLEAAAALHARGIVYLHLTEADWDDAPTITESFRRDLRGAFPGTIVAAGKYDATKAQWALDHGYADLIGFGRLFIANPDLPRRLREQADFNPLDGATLFGGAAPGYTDYPHASAAAPGRNA